MSKWKGLPDEVRARIQDPFTMHARLPEGIVWKHFNALGHPLWLPVRESEFIFVEANTRVVELDKIVIIREAFPVWATMELIEYGSVLLRQGLLSKTDEAPYNINRLGANGDPLCNWLMRQFMPVVEQATRLTLSESYSFYSHYMAGSALGAHKDVPRCPVNVSIHLGSNPAVVNWPLFVHPDGLRMPYEIQLNPGDAAIYFGSTQTHWRERMADAVHWVNVLLFHYMIEE